MSAAERLQSLRDAQSAANEKAGNDFLKQNARRETVVTLPSGLQYEVLVPGTGQMPGLHHTVTCHYEGTLINGEVFDSSVKRGQPASFPLNAVIKGWTEALQLMGTGSKWRLFIPPGLAYGDRQVSAKIGPNSTLVFDVELISFR